MVKEEKEDILDLQKILDNTPETLEVPDMGKILVKYPTTRDKLDAKKTAIELTQGLAEEDTLTEQARILAIKMIVEPKISIKDYLASDDVKMSILLDTVHMWYTVKMKGLQKKRQKQVRDFLDQMKES